MSDNYEMMYILRPDMGEEQVNQAIAKYRDILQEQGADQIDIQHRGKRRLAYPIDRHREGIYIQMNYKAPGSHVAIIERAMRIGEDVIRYLTLKQEEPAADKQAEPVEVEG
ncbi:MULTISPECIES: 30S ribosomal protein S6 [unclassified Coleofasciculus]|uniref:30S ribosomal protein S6 n=1 Tax=unclassified Coleofasciculus TaxID=2692782 RepID=UPI001882FDA9|nr:MULTISPECIES: 30S ribosomal protein S6 [unclassified Coleofasciculus]MBE9125535.1 30S ribosomal protein S6 [Coleofasciculus sp. LEGE 07081]MBE9147830.1 30S ribosomal protein S6 [Coleofasciculus sp. LEGE 07092]